ncbi:MAG: hypothetical protein ACKO19_04655, partial [Betaproteobacteria bacterium]
LKRFDSSAEAVINQLRDWGYSLRNLNPKSQQLTDLDDQFHASEIHNVLAYKAIHMDRVKPLL